MYLNMLIKTNVLYKLYNKLSYDYIIKHFDSVKSHDYWFDKSVMIDDLKMNLLEKSGFGKESISYQKYNVLLDILTKSPKKIIDELKEYDEQENFLSTVLLLDAEKVRDLKFVYLTNIKEAFKETSKLEKKFSDSLFFNTSETINHFLNKVHPPIGAQFIVEYKDDIKNLVDYLIPIGDKIKSIFSAEWKSENEPKSKELKSEKIGETKNKKGTIISENILFDLIINAFSKNKELALLWVNYLSDECFFNLITFIYLNPFTIDNRKQATFFMLIQDFYNSYKILFINLLLFVCFHLMQLSSYLYLHILFVCGIFHLFEFPLQL